MKRNVLFAVVVFALAGCSDDKKPLEVHLVKMDVTPATSIVAAGKSRRLLSELVADDGSRFDVSGTADWSSSDLTLATADSGGLVKGLAAGMVTISAARDGFTGNAQLMVLAHDIVTITVAPATVTMQKGDTFPLVAMAKLTDNSMIDVTQSAMWTSNNMAAVTVSHGVLTAVDFGQATVNAASTAVQSNNVSVTVGNAEVDAGSD
jgi:hypothetical protein